MHYVIRLGDKTSHGGEVVSAADNYSIMGKAVARVGDYCTCPIKGHGQCQIVSGDPYWSIDGRAVAIQGISKTSCGAELISSLGNLSRSFEGDGVASGGGVTPAYATNHSAEQVQEEEFDDRYVLNHPETGKPLPDRAFALLLSDGEMRYGTSDASGKTDFVQTGDAPDIVELYIEGV